MKIIMFYHSLISDWNHGNAHFLRGIATEFITRGNNIEVWEPENSWSRTNLIKDYGIEIQKEFFNYYPQLKTNFYNVDKYSLSQILKEADIVIVHEWNDHLLVSDIGKLKRQLGYRLFFHDTHHRILTEEEEIRRYDLKEYDGVIAFGNVIRNKYLENGYTKKAWTVHEAADINVFYPRREYDYEGDIVWIGNWGDDERSSEIREFLFEPVKELNLKCSVYGVRYPVKVINELSEAGISYKGWIPNYKVPEVFAKYKLTVHIPRRPYAKKLKGIPTIRPFEAMACGIPLISAPWEDEENLFTPGKDFLFAENKNDMKNKILELLNNKNNADNLANHALKTILNKHTCSHRAEQLYSIFRECGIE